MVLPLLGRETRHRQTLIASQENRAEEEQRRAALGYLIWPAALYERYAEREPASSWYRTQVRQAVRFGLRASAAGVAALVWPLLFSLAFPNVVATLAAYSVAILLDVILFAGWLRHALRYRKRAARGETFALEPFWSPGRLGRTRSQGG